jgi:hypothetical protein
MISRVLVKQVTNNLVIPTGVFMGLRPTQVDEKPLLRFTHELVISTEAKRSGEICGSFSG